MSPSLCWAGRSAPVSSGALLNAIWKTSPLNWTSAFSGLCPVSASYCPSSRKQVVLGLETGNLEPAAYMKLQRGGIDGYFSFGGFGSDSEERAEFIRTAITRARNIDHDFIPDENIYVIGDSPHDIAAGRSAGVKTIAVATGSAGRETLMAQSPTHFLPDLRDTTVFLRCIGL